MRNFKKIYFASAAIVAANFAFAAPAAAEDGAANSPVNFGGYVSLLSDYRLRGASLSDNQPVIQGGVEASVPVSESFEVYGGVWGSSLDKEAGAGAMETDFYAGAKTTVGGVSLKARYLRLAFHDAENIDFDQFEAGMSAPVGPINLGAGVVHDEYQGGGNSTYGYTKASYDVPGTALGLNALVGYENGSNWDNKLNWQIGASYAMGAVTFGASYIDTNRLSLNSEGKNRAGSGAVFSISGNF